MARYGMVIDLHGCVGCGACAIACKNENAVPTGAFRAHHLVVESGAFPNVRYEYIPTLCNHCANAACVAACPTGAMFKDENGLTLRDPEVCVACKTCVDACPYGAVTFGEQIEKCTFCNHRLEAGLAPYCSEVCPAGARVFGDLDDPASAASQILAATEGRVLQPEAQTSPAVYYVGEY